MEARPGEQACEDCGIPVHYLHVAGESGLPDLITLTFPDSGWLGWYWVQPFAERTADSKPALVVLCSKSCVVHWFAAEAAPREVTECVG
jgi:hypothetical protein